MSFQYSKAKLLATVFLFRVLYLFAMATSCHLIPEHNPGDGVLRFDMRLNEDTDCFCLKGHACDSIGFGIPDSTKDKSFTNCAIPSVSGSFVPLDLWKFFLAPLTKWDAARFLTLAVDPSLRDPQPHASDSFAVSEQAHAFLPMFPWAMQQFAFFLYKTLPAQVLPPTFEGLVVFAGMLFNNFVCSTVSILALYSLTTGAMANSSGKPREQNNHRHSIAVAVCLVFGVWNPALVFFATNYSESFFAASTILGHFCIQQSKRKNSILLWFAGIACWMVGSYTRSNGTLQCLWLLQDGLALVLLLHRKSNASVGRSIAICIQSILGAGLVALPVRYHDWKGWERHCVISEKQPLWCSYNGSSFSLYRHIQDKHWNVGFFRYYELKQIPNFLLAAPILILSITGVYRWIYWSLITVHGKGKAPSSYKNILVGWPVNALSESVSIASESSKTSYQSTLSSESRLLLQNPLLLGHYAILSILAFLGLTIAHVQISTRMICSTSPAIIWCIAQSIVQSSSMEDEGKSHGLFSWVAKNQSKIVWVYVSLFMFLGVILHVNFLPWT